jgi:hypothetical protein
LQQFHDDKITASKAWWKEVRRGINDTFSAGADAIPDALTPGQSNKL